MFECNSSKNSSFREFWTDDGQRAMTKALSDSDEITKLLQRGTPDEGHIFKHSIDVTRKLTM